MNITDEEGRARLAFWVQFLEKLVNWPEERTLEWAWQFHEDLNDQNSLLFHESHFWEPLHEVIPTRIKEKLSPLQIRLFIGKLDSELSQRRRELGHSNERFWSEAKAIFDNNFREHGSSYQELIDEIGNTE